MVTKKRKRRNYTSTFKKQIVQLYQNRKSKSDIAKEYDIHISAMCRVLKISGSTYYYKPVKKEDTDILEQIIKNIQRQ